MTDTDVWYRCIHSQGMHCRGKIQGANHENCEAAGPLNANAGLNKHHAEDLVNHPPHYTNHPSGVECITITEAFDFNIGNAIKYLWRAGLKGDQVDDLRKAAWYINREIGRIT